RDGGGAASRQLVAQFDRFLPLIDQVIDQATRRVLGGEAVPAKEKVVSLFEPHAQIIVRHKAGKPAEFGHKLWLDEVEGGIVSRYALLPEVGPEDAYLAESLAAHRARFGKPPDLLAGDRGVSSPATERRGKGAGVRRVALPRVGKPPPERVAEERGRAFRRAYRFRAGVEGRIHVLRRDYGLDRCRDKGEAAFGRWVGWGVLAHNL